jgi:hypothetical protein
MSDFGMILQKTEGGGKKGTINSRLKQSNTKYQSNKVIFIHVKKQTGLDTAMPLKKWTR